MIRQKFSIGGIIPISGFIRFKKRAEIEATNESKGTSILLLHGENDKIIDCMESKEALKTLRAIGYHTFIELFSTGHKIPIQARDKIQDFVYS
jgi:predicted esterase